MRLHRLLPKTNGIPVLMYHHVIPGKRDSLTVTPDQLRRQWAFLKAHDYVCLTLQRFLAILRGEEAMPEKCFLLTFDDGYTNNLTYAYPLLKEFNWSAALFLIGNKLCRKKAPATGDYELLSTSQLCEMDSRVFEPAMHGFDHENFSKLSTEEAISAIKQMIGAFEESGLSFHRVLAYPYGKRPKSEINSKEIEAVLKYAGVEAAFGIGNKLQSTKSADPYKLNRIDIRGEDSLEDFIVKLQKGKLKPF